MAEKVTAGREANEGRSDGVFVGSGGFSTVAFLTDDSVRLKKGGKKGAKLRIRWERRALR